MSAHQEAVKISATEFARHTGWYLDLAAGGKVVEITRSSPSGRVIERFVLAKLKDVKVDDDGKETP